MIVHLPRSPRADTLFPYTSVLRSWIDYRPPVALAGGGLALQLLEHRSLHEAAAAGDIVGLGRPGGELEGALGAVDRGHFAGAGQRRLHGKAAGEGVAVEHADIDRKSTRLNSSH